MEKKFETLGIAFSGAFFEKEFLQDFLYMKLGYSVCEECDFDTFKMFTAYLEMSEFKPTVGRLFLLDAKDMKTHEDPDLWFIGVHIKELPERMSKKRFNIEVREMLIKAKLITEKDTDPNLIRFIFDTITIHR